MRTVFVSLKHAIVQALCLRISGLADPWLLLPQARHNIHEGLGQV